MALAAYVGPAVTIPERSGLTVWLRGRGAETVGRAPTAATAAGGFRLASPLTAVVLGAVELAMLIGSGLVSISIHQAGLTGSSGVWIAVAFGVVGVVVAARQPGNPMGWILLGATGFLLLSDVASTYSVLDYRMHHGRLPLGAVAVFLQPTWAPAVLLIGLSVLVYPEGQLPSRRWSWVLWAVLAAGALFQLGAFTVALGAIIGHNIHVDSGGNLLIIDNATGRWRWWTYVQGVFFVVVGVSWLAWLVREVPIYLRSSGERRLQQKWFLSGVTIFVIGGALSVGLGSSKGIWGHVGQAEAIGFLALPISIGVGILKFRLYDIDRLISRTLAYAIVSAFVVGVYIGIITLTTKALGFHTPVAVAASTLAAVALFNPLRVRVQRVVDRRFNRARYDAEATVAAFTTRLRDAVDLETVRAELLEVVNRSVEAAHASVWIRWRNSG